MKKTPAFLQSRRTRGALWIVAAIPMLLAPLVFVGNPAIAAIGVMFLIFGLVTLKS